MVGRTLVLVPVLLLGFCVPSAMGWEGHVAVHAGGSFTRAQYESDYFDGDSRFGGPGALFGFTSVAPLGRQTGLEIETGVLFNQRGGETDFLIVRKNLDGDVLWERTDTYDWRLWYATVPLSVRYSFAENGRVYLKAGVELAFLLEAKLESPVYDYGSEEEPDVEYVVRSDWDNFNFYDYSVLAAAGYKFPVGGLNGFVELSYVAGLRDVLNVKDAAFDAKLRNTAISLSAGVLFDYDF